MTDSTTAGEMGSDSNEESEDRDLGTRLPESGDDPRKHKKILRNGHLKIEGYQIIREIGRGGMGVVFEAMDLRLHRVVALKVLPEGAQVDRLRVIRFKNESMAAAQLRHANIIPVYRAEDSGPLNYFTMPLIEGVNLSQLVRAINREISRPNGSRKPLAKSSQATADDMDITTPDMANQNGLRTPLPRVDASSHSAIELGASDFGRRSGKHVCTTRVASAVARIGTHVADALQHAHEIGIIHRDIKPSNLMLDTQGKIWVADFGLAHIAGAPTLTRFGTAIGTTRYMSPEQASGMHGMVDHRTDIYSLGVTLTELLTLRPLFSGNTDADIIRQIVYGPPPKLRQIDPGIPEDLAIILEKSISKDPIDRYTTAAEFAEDLGRFVRNEPIQARRPSLMKRARQWVKRHQGVAVAAGVALSLVLVLSTTAAIFFSRQAQIYLSALKKSESYRATVESEKTRATNPGLSVQMAIQAVRLQPGYEAKLSLQRSLDSNYEYVAVRPRNVVSGDVAAAPNGEEIVTCVGRLAAMPPVTPEALIHSSKNGSVVRKIDNGEWIIAASYSHSGRFLVTSSIKPGAPLAAAPGPPTVWDTTTNSHRVLDDAILNQHHEGMYHPSLERIVLSVGDEAVIFDLATGHALVTIRDHRAKILHTEFSPDGRLVLTLGDDGKIRFWDAATAKPHGQMLQATTPVRDPVRVHFVSDSNAVVLMEGFRARRISIEGDARSLADDVVLTLTDLAVGRHQQQFISMEPNGIVVRNTLDLNVICELQVPVSVGGAGYPFSTMFARFHPHEKRAIVVADADAFVFDTTNGRMLAELKGHQYPILDAEFSGEKVVTVANDRMLRMWNSSSGLMERTFVPSQTNGVFQREPLLATSANDEYLAISIRSIQQSIRRDLQGKAIPGNVSGAVSVAAVPSADRLLSFDGDTAIVTELSSSRELYRGSFGSPLHHESALLVNGEYFIAHTLDGKAWLVNVETQSRMLLGTQAQGVNGVYPSMDLTQVVVTFLDGKFEAYDVLTRRVVWSRQHSQMISYIALSPDGERFVLLDSSGNIEVWLIDGWKQECRIGAKGEPPDRLRFLADGAGFIAWNANNCDRVSCYRLAEPNHEIVLPAVGTVRVEVHPTAPHAIVCGSDRTVLWQPYDGKVVPLYTDRGTRAACWTRDRIGTVAEPGISERGEFRLFDLEGNPIAAEPLDLKPTFVQSDIHRNQFIIAVAGDAVEVFDLVTARSKLVTPVVRGNLIWIGFSKDQPRIITVSDSGHVTLTDMSGKIVSESLATEGQISCCVSDKGGNTLWIGTADGELVQWAIRESEAISRSKDHQRAIRSIELTANGLLTIAVNEHPRYWQINPLKSAEVAIEDVVQADMAQVGKPRSVLIALDERKAPRAYLLDHDAGGVKPLLGDKMIRQAKFSPDCKRLLVLLQTGTVQVLSAETLAPISEVSLVNEGIRTVDILDEKGTELLVSHGRSMSLWDVASATIEMQMDCQIESNPFTRQSHLHTADRMWIIAADRLNGRVKKWPRRILEYTLSRIPRTISSEEVKQFRLNEELLQLPQASP